MRTIAVVVFCRSSPISFISLDLEHARLSVADPLVDLLVVLDELTRFASGDDYDRHVDVVRYSYICLFSWIGRRKGKVCKQKNGRVKSVL